ncbi:MAG: ATP-binding protein, partial [Phenylobacterium sp.]
REVWTVCTAQVTTDPEGKPRRLLGAMQNVTERKLQERALLYAKEEAEAATRTKSAFLATMSHEIRTPLNGVLGMMQAMEADRLSAAQRTRLQAAREAGEALSVILQDVVELAAIETGRFKLRDGEFDLAQVVGAACAGAAVEAQAKPLRLLVDLEPDSLGTYRGDAKRIRQALAKLLDNAVRFTAAGEVVLTGRADPDGALRLTVRDTGQGIPARKLQQLFEPFELADASRTRRHGGAGLGLAIAREFARAMGGEIEVVSQVGQGSAFTLRLPLLRLAAPAPAPPARVRQEAPDLSRVRLLAAEDNPMNQLVLKTLLGQHGLDPVLVDNGAEAVAAWRQGGFDVILMDVQMPELDGAAATRAIRAEEAARGLPRTPIIALTANAMPYQIEEYRQAGMDAHVAKPVEAGLLHDAIVEALKRPAQEAAAAA